MTLVAAKAGRGEKIGSEVRSPTFKRMPMRRFVFLLSALLSVSLLCGPAHAVDRHVAGMRLAASCANCHGTNGTAVSGGFASLAGWPKKKMLDQLHAYQSSDSKATVMRQLVKGYSEDELVLIADYYAALPAPTAAPASTKK
jgi:cytochrome c553